MEEVLFRDLEYLGGAKVFTRQIFEAISQSSFFEEFTREDCDHLCEYMHCFAAPPGKVLLEEGREGDFMIITLSGKVQVSKMSLRGDPVTLAVVGPGSLLGEMSLIDGEHRFASCTTIAPACFAVLTRAELTEVLFTYPRLGNKLLLWILRIAIGRFRDLDMRTVLNVPGFATTDANHEA